MAVFEMQLPTEEMRQFRELYINADEIFGTMTRKGADVALKSVRRNKPSYLPDETFNLTRTYYTPSDDGINTKVYVADGWLPFKGNRTSFTRRGRKSHKKKTKYTTYKGIPYDFMVKITEYGSSERYTDDGQYRGIFRKNPFFRRSFSQKEIEAAMKKAQSELTGGLLDE